jgi:hypothetical protein
MAPLFTGLARNLGGYGFGRSAEVPFSASGGNQTPSTGLAPGNGYKYHTFTSPGTFTLNSVGGTSSTIEVIVIGGGGGGGSEQGGGGGAGALLYNNSYSVSVGPYSVVIGGGGNGGASGYGSSGPGSVGSQSSFGPLTAAGGGYGGGRGPGGQTGGGPGGSGGGGNGAGWFRYRHHQILNINTQKQ